MEEKNSMNEIVKLMHQIGRTMDMSRDKQIIIDVMNEDIMQETRPMMVERMKKDIEHQSQEKKEFDEMTKSSLIRARDEVLTLRDNIEKEYQEKLIETAEKQAEAEEKLKRIQTKLNNMRNKGLSEEDMQKAEKLANEATKKVENEIKKNNGEMQHFQSKHFIKRAKLDEFNKNLQDYAIEIGFEREFAKVKLERPTAEKTSKYKPEAAKPEETKPVEEKPAEEQQVEEPEPVSESETETEPDQEPEQEPEPQPTPKEILAQKIFSTIANYGSIDAKKESEMLNQYLHEHGTQGINDLKEISNKLKTATYNEEKYRIFAENYAQLIDSSISIYETNQTRQDFDMGAAIEGLQDVDHQSQTSVDEEQQPYDFSKTSKVIIENDGVTLIDNNDSKYFQPKLGIIKGFLERLRVVSALPDGIEEEDMPVVPLTKFFKINPTVTKRMTGEQLKEYILALRGEGTTSYEIIDNRGEQKMLPPYPKDRGMAEYVEEPKQSNEEKPTLRKRLQHIGKVRTTIWGGYNGKYTSKNVQAKRGDSVKERE